jgi:hypothetical protein
VFFFCLFTISSARVSALVIVLNDSPCEKIGKWGTCLILKKGVTLVRVQLEHLPHYYVSRERQFLRLCRHTRIMGRQHQGRGTVSENLHSQKGDRSTLRTIISKNHRTTAVQVNCSRTEYPSRRSRFHKTVRRELHKSSTHGRAANAIPLITKSNAQMCKRWCHDHKTWTSDN